MKELLEEVRKLTDVLPTSEQEVSRWIRKSRAISRVQRIPGDASSRWYYRVVAKQGSFVLMQMEAFESLGRHLPFLLVQQHLKACGIDVPDVLDTNPEKGFLLLEDLGDDTLLRVLQGVSDADVERKIYERVIDVLVDLQTNASKPSSEFKALASKTKLPFNPFELRFDFKKLFWEVENTVEHFYEGYLERKLRKQDRNILKDQFGEICQILAGLPTVLAHRDFHSRNIMILQNSRRKKLPFSSEDRIVLIDFQDARMGPPQYDLVSLLRDSYYQLPEDQLSYLVQYYIKRYEKKTGTKINKEKFQFHFDLMAVQRNFKAIGSFASFLNKRGDAKYLKFIGNTFENIRRTLVKYPQYSELREVLFYYYYF